MDGILKLFLDYFVILFFDDIIVYSKNMEEHASQLHIVLGILREKWLVAKFSKCDFWSF